MKLQIKHPHTPNKKNVCDFFATPYIFRRTRRTCRTVKKALEKVAVYQVYSYYIYSNYYISVGFSCTTLYDGGPKCTTAHHPVVHFRGLSYTFSRVYDGFGHIYISDS